MAIPRTKPIAFLASTGSICIFLFCVLSAETTCVSGFVEKLDQRHTHAGNGRRCRDGIPCYSSKQGGDNIAANTNTNTHTNTNTNGTATDHRASTNGVATDHRASTNANANTGEQLQSWERSAIDWIDDILDQKSKQSPFAIEVSDRADGGSVPFEWIVGGRSPGPGASGIPAGASANSIGTVALRTTGSTPLLDAESIASIRSAAQNIWDGHQNNDDNDNDAPTPTSRFTLQFADTNSECHLDQLVASDDTGKLQEIVDTLLTTRVYPLVRSVFGGSSNNNNGDGDGDGPQLTDGSLCVYDSLVIRYNGNKATSRFDASQPLHRDGGVVSVNIALNSHNDDADADADADTIHCGEPNRFAGGGTFFEDLMGDGDGDSHAHNDDKDGSNPILRPIGTGHAVVHWSTKRHAGAPTTSGTRDILVIFLTQRNAAETQRHHDDPVVNPDINSSNSNSNSKTRFPSIERSFHLKLKAKESPREMAIRCLNLAIKETPFDGQAHFLKGVQLMRGGTNSNHRGSPSNTQEIDNENEQEQERWLELNQGIYHLSRAAAYSPFDARIHSSLGTAYRQRWMFAKRTHRTERLASFASVENQTENQTLRQQERRELRNARDALERALALHERYRRHGISSDFEPDDASLALLTIGEVSMQLEQYGDALRWLSEIESGNPGAGVSDAMRDHVATLMAHCKDQIRDETETKAELSVS